MTPDTPIEEAGSPFQRAHQPRPLDAATPSGSGRRFTPLASVRAHWRLSAIVALVIVIAGVPVAYLKGAPRYQATAVIQVAPRFAGNMGTAGGDKELELQSNTQYREFVQQQVRSVNRFDVATAALATLDARGVAWRHPDESTAHSVERLQWALRIRPVPDTYLIEVIFEDDDPRDMAAVVNTVVDTFLATAKREELFESDDRIARLTQESEQMQSALNALMSRRTALAESLVVTTFNESTRNPYDEVLMAARTQLATARARRIDADAHVKALDERARPGGAAALAAAANELVSRDSGLMSLKSSLYQRRAALLAKVSGLSPDHPGRAAIDRELGEIDAEVDRVSDRLRAEISSTITSQAASELFAAERAERELASQVEGMGSQSKLFATGYQQAVVVGGEIDRLRRRRDAIEDRIDFLRLETHAPGFFRLVTAARAPETPIAGGRKRLAVLVVLAAIVIGLLLALAIDALDTRVHTADELRAVAAMPVLGAVSDRVTADARALAADGIERIGTALLRDLRAHGTRVVAFTDIKSAGGGTDVVMAVALDLSARGHRVLVIETDTLDADSRYEALALDGPNLRDILAGAPVPVPTDSPSVISARPLSGRHIDHLGKLERVLQHATAFDLVLLDTAPLLLSADTTWLAGLADLTLVVVQASVTTRWEVKRTLTHLAASQPAAVGVVLNGVAVTEALFDRANVATEFAGATDAPVTTGSWWRRESA